MEKDTDSVRKSLISPNGDHYKLVILLQNQINDTGVSFCFYSTILLKNYTDYFANASKSQYRAKRGSSCGETALPPLQSLYSVTPNSLAGKDKIKYQLWYKHVILGLDIKQTGIFLLISMKIHVFTSFRNYLLCSFL